MIHRGDSGPAIEKIQQQLIEQGFVVGIDSADHVFGRDTYNAITMFQACHLGRDGRPLKVDGLVGPETTWALEHPSSSDQAPPVDQSIIDQVVPGLAGKALQIGLEELRRGVKEKPDGSNRGERIDLYTGCKADAGVKGPAWCAYFVSWCIDKAADGKSPMGIIGSAQNIMHWGQRNNCCLVPGAAILRVGDIFIIARDDVHGHCGFIRQVLPGAAPTAGFRSLEGNAGNAVRSYPRKIETITAIVRLPEPQAAS